MYFLLKCYEYFLGKIVDSKVHLNDTMTQFLVVKFGSIWEIKLNTEREQNALYCAAIECFTEFEKKGILSYGQGKELCHALIKCEAIVSHGEDVRVTTAKFFIELFRHQRDKKFLTDLFDRGFKSQIDFMFSCQNGIQNGVPL